MSKRKRLGDRVMGICVDCNQLSLARDEYIVRDSVWMQCGMGAWDAGYLHRECLEKRLGRELAEDELLVWPVGEKNDAVLIDCHPDYDPQLYEAKVSENCLAPPDGNYFRHVKVKKSPVRLRQEHTGEEYSNDAISR